MYRKWVFSINFFVDVIGKARLLNISLENESSAAQPTNFNNNLNSVQKTAEKPNEKEKAVIPSNNIIQKKPEKKPLPSKNEPPRPPTDRPQQVKKQSEPPVEKIKVATPIPTKKQPEFKPPNNVMVSAQQNLPQKKDKPKEKELVPKESSTPKSLLF